MTDRPDLNLERIRKNLQAERDDIIGVSASAVDDRRPVELDQQSVGRVSRMDALRVQAMAQAVEARRQGRLHRIEEALRRLAAGDYGSCSECGEAIPAKRLSIDPTNERCVHCAL